MPKFEGWQIAVNQADSGETEIQIYSLIFDGASDEYTTGLNTVMEAIGKAKGDIKVRINSKGGEVGAAVTIFNRLQEYDKGKVTTIVDGHAYSAGGLVAQAGDERLIKKNATFMCHNARMFVPINSLKALDAAREAWSAHQEQVVSILMEKTSLNEDDLRAMMEAETFLNAEQAVEKGFFDRVDGTPHISSPAHNQAEVKTDPGVNLARLQRFRINH